MKTKHEFIFALDVTLMVVCLLALVGCSGVKVSAPAYAPSFTIKGVITNVADAKSRAVIKGDSYLQVVSVSDRGIFFDGEGRVGAVDHGLPKTAMPGMGQFSIACEGLKLGTYLVAVQPAKTLHQQIAFLLRKDGQTLQIKVSKDIGPILDVGDVTIPIQ
jgi:hypothetical protein